MNEPTPEAIRECYINQNMTQLEIAAYFGCGVKKIRKLMKQQGIEVKTISQYVEKRLETNPDYIPAYNYPKAGSGRPAVNKNRELTYEDLHEAYVLNKMSTRQIGSLYGVSRATVSNTLKKLGIPARLVSSKPITRIGGYKGTLRAFYNIYRRGAEARNYAFELTIEQFESLVTSPCFFCGAPPSQKRRNHVFSGIDRSNNAIGYIPSNVRPCCGTCNRAKHTISEPEFIQWVLKVADHLKSTSLNGQEVAE